MRKQKIVMKVEMNSNKSRSKALKVVVDVAANGVNFLGLEGDEKDKVVVIGDGVDAATLACCLRKKVGPTKLLTVAELK